MKKILILLVVIGLGFGALNVAGNHYRYDLFHLALSYEADKAKLQSKSLVIEDSLYFYLSRPNDTSTETLVLLHGFSANKENWLRFVQLIPEHYQVFALDLLGHGDHPIDLQKDYSIEAQVAYVHQFIGQHVKQPVHLVGNSMGGAIASLYSSMHPDNVKSLLLISPAGVHDIPSELESLLDQGNNPLIANSIPQFYEVVNFVMADPPFIPQPVLRVQAEKSVARYELNHKIFNDIRQDLAKNLEANFSRIQAPTLILWGQEDRVLHPDNIERYVQLIPNAQGQLLEGIGHLAMLENPKKVAQAFMQLSAQTAQLSN